MIVVQMMGNLGNQLFIYAMARSLQLEYGDDIVFDLGGLKRFYYSSEYRLDRLNLPKEKISVDLNEIPTDIKKRYIRTSKLYHIEQKFYRIIRKDSLVPDKVTMRWLKRGCYYTFSRSYFDFPKITTKDKFVYGYFQNAKYFEKYADIIRPECMVSDEPDDYDRRMLPLIQNSNSVAVSIRAINEFGVSFIDYDYYCRAMEMLDGRIDNPTFFVFSDDVEAVKEKVKFPYPVEYVTPRDSCHGLRLMYNCKHFIIANSTFSWWGAYLGNNPEKTVIMPDKIDKEGAGREGYYFQEAIRIPCSFIRYKWDLDQIIHQKYAK